MVKSRARNRHVNVTHLFPWEYARIEQKGPKALAHILDYALKVDCEEPILVLNAPLAVSCWTLQ